MCRFRFDGFAVGRLFSSYTPLHEVGMGKDGLRMAFTFSEQSRANRRPCSVVNESNQKHISRLMNELLSVLHTVVRTQTSSPHRLSSSYTDD